MLHPIDIIIGPPTPLPLLRAPVPVGFATGDEHQPVALFNGNDIDEAVYDRLGIKPDCLAAHAHSKAENRRHEKLTATEAGRRGTP